MNLMVDELARQVKRHRDKLRHRREAHAARARVPENTRGADGTLGLSTGRACFSYGVPSRMSSGSGAGRPAPGGVCQDGPRLSRRPAPT